MPLHLLTPPPETPTIIDLGFAAGVKPIHVRAELENMFASLARHQGDDTALAIMIEAFALMFAGRALASRHAVAWRYAMQAELDKAESAADSARNAFFASLGSGKPLG